MHPFAALQYMHELAKQMSEHVGATAPRKENGLWITDFFLFLKKANLSYPKIICMLDQSISKP